MPRLHLPESPITVRMVEKAGRCALRGPTKRTERIPRTPRTRRLLAVPGVLVVLGVLLLGPVPERQIRLAVAARGLAPQPLVVAELGGQALAVQRHVEPDAAAGDARVVEVVGGSGAEAVVGLARRFVAEAPDVPERRFGG